MVNKICIIQLLFLIYWTRVEFCSKVHSLQASMKHVQNWPHNRPPADISHFQRTGIIQTTFSFLSVVKLEIGSSDGTESACNAGDLGSILGSGRSPGEGNGNPLQYTCLENPMDSLVDHSPWGRKESDVTEQLTISLLLGQISFKLLSDKKSTQNSWRRKEKKNYGQQEALQTF